MRSISTDGAMGIWNGKCPQTMWTPEARRDILGPKHQAQTPIGV
jgi:hypothetical protein